jgi:hypothetical protein
MRPARFALLFALHILTTAFIPIALFILGFVNSVQTLELIILLAGLWSLLGAALMIAADARWLRAVYAIAGFLLVGLAALLFLKSIA